MTQVLVVEDSPTQAELLRNILESEGLVPFVAGSAEEALDLIESETVDLVLSDVLMPGMSGYDLCRRIKQSPESKHIPVILLTWLKSPMDIIQGLECGADNFLTKPFEADHLVARIRSFLDNRKLRANSWFSLGVDILFFGQRLTITSEKEQILDLLIATFEDTVRTNRELEASRAELTAAKRQVEEYARRLEGQVQETEARYRRLFDNASDAILVIDVDTGSIVDANASAARLFRQPAAILVGQDEASLPWVGAITLRHLWSDPDAEAPARDMRVAQPDGTLLHLEARGGRLEHAGQNLFQASLRDVTERHQAEGALRESENRLRLEREFLETLLRRVPVGIAITEAGSGRAMILNDKAAELLGHPQTDAGVERYAQYEAVHADGRRYGIEEFPTLRALRSGEVVEREPLVYHHPDGRVLRIEVNSAPVREEGGRIVAAVTALVDVTERAEAEEHQRLLTAELSHRVKNVLAVVQGLANLTLAHSPSLGAFAETFQGRLEALGRAHGHILRSDWKSVDLRILAEEELAPYRTIVRIEGDSVLLTPKQGVAMALILHEITTNAAKHGAFARVGGNAELSWRSEIGEGGRMVRLAWRESGAGPSTIRAEGFGVRLIRRSVAGDLGGSCRIHPGEDGLVWEMIFPPGPEKAIDMTLEGRLTA